MSDDEFGSIGEEAIDALYDTGYATAALISGDVDVAVDRYLDASSSALDAVTDGGFSHLVDRFEADTGIDARETFQWATQYVGEAIGDAAWGATESLGEVYGDVSETAGEVYDTVSETAGEAYDYASETAGEAYDTVAGWFE